MSIQATSQNQEKTIQKMQVLGAEGGILQRRTASAGEVSTVPPSVHDVLRSPGQPLDAATRAFMEPRFSHDFSNVRVHNDAKAAESAQAVNAQAYTVGRDVVFGAGQHAPTSSEGRKLMAHELTHVVQQKASQPSSSVQLVSENDLSEKEAANVATSVVKAQVTPRRIGGLSAPISNRGSSRKLQRTSFGKDGELSSSHKAIVQQAVAIIERRIMLNDFDQQWTSFWERYGKFITPKPTLNAFRDSVKGRIVNDMESSNNEKVKEFLKGEKGFPLERQTAAVTFPGSRDTYMRRFAIEQGVDSAISLLLHESWHGAGIGMGPFEAFETAFHEFETAAGYPIMMGGAKIESLNQKRRGNTGIDVTVKYSLHKIGKDPLPGKIELQVAEGDSATVVYQMPIPAKAGRNVVHWQPENPGWQSYSIRIHNIDEGSLMAASRIDANPRCVLGVSKMHCEND